jgi:hypothetical protein
MILPDIEAAQEEATRTLTDLVREAMMRFIVRAVWRSAVTQASFIAEPPTTIAKIAKRVKQSCYIFDTAHQAIFPGWSCSE